MGSDSNPFAVLDSKIQGQRQEGIESRGCEFVPQDSRRITCLDHIRARDKGECDDN